MQALAKGTQWAFVPCLLSAFGHEDISQFDGRHDQALWETKKEPADFLPGFSMSKALQQGFVKAIGTLAKGQMSRTSSSADKLKVLKITSGRAMAGLSGKRTWRDACSFLTCKCKTGSVWLLPESDDDWA